MAYDPNANRRRNVAGPKRHRGQANSNGQGNSSCIELNVPLMFRQSPRRLTPSISQVLNMSFFPTIAPAFLEEMVACLLHLFIRGAGGNEAAARYAVLSTLAAYDPEDEQELRLAAKIISFGFATLEGLAKAMNSDLPLNAVLRLRGNANAAHRSGHQCQRTLDKLQKERRMAAGLAAARSPAPERPANPTDTAEAINAGHPGSTPPALRQDLSRQQRRELERKALKAQRKQAERARLDAKMASRIATLPVSAMNSSPQAGINLPYAA
jgi:hypothetical protein